MEVRILFGDSVCISPINLFSFFSWNKDAALCKTLSINRDITKTMECTEYI
jgi:hypothetical protein